jgi:hypothetical protein
VAVTAAQASPAGVPAAWLARCRRRASAVFGSGAGDGCA